jgi:hypothetical protein
MARVEAAMVEAFLVEEVTNNLSLYFKSTAPSIRNKIPRYDDALLQKVYSPRGPSSTILR